MDVAPTIAEGQGNLVNDEVAVLCQKKFQDFLEEVQTVTDEGVTQSKYLEAAKELVNPERNTLQVSMRDIQVHNEQLSDTITMEYYRVYPYLCAAIKNFVKDHADNFIDNSKDFYLSLTEVDIVHKVSIDFQYHYCCNFAVKEHNLAILGKLEKLI